MKRSWSGIAILILLLALLALLACGGDDVVHHDDGCAVARAPRDAGPRVLFVGNSLTDWFDMPGILAGLLHEAGFAFYRIETIALPNFGLVDHWQRPQTRAAIAGGWDLVVLQQGPSATEGRPSLLEYSQRFATEIRDAGGEPALFMVWPAASNLDDLDGVSDSYATAAELVDGLLFPVGEAWRSAWARDEDLRLYDDDGFHPSILGSYLAALVFFEQITGLDPAVLSGEFCVPGWGRVELSAGLTELLQEAAAEANANFARRVARDR